MLIATFPPKVATIGGLYEALPVLEGRQCAQFVAIRRPNAAFLRHVAAVCPRGVAMAESDALFWCKIAAMTFAALRRFTLFVAKLTGNVAMLAGKAALHGLRKVGDPQDATFGVNIATLWRGNVQQKGAQPLAATPLGIF
ncbi:MAG: hypothetical protein ACJ759_02740 [Thermoanaerobaculia bacterium]